MYIKVQISDALYKALVTSGLYRPGQPERGQFQCFRQQ